MLVTFVQIQNLIRRKRVLAGCESILCSYKEMKDIELFKGNCLQVINDLVSDGIKVDSVIADIPYGTISCQWDSIIPFNDYIEIDGKKMYEEEYLLYCYKNENKSYEYCRSIFNENKKSGLWTYYNRIIKDHGAILLFAQTPFNETLGNSNKNMLRYEWIWEKTQATGHLNAKKMPMKAHKNVLVFYKKLPTYNPQKTTGHSPIHSYTKYVDTQNNTEIYGHMDKEISGGGETDRYQRSVITFASDKQTSYLHSTQKPLALCEYMIKTYTNEGELVLDSCMGSNTTGLACKNLNRKYIGIEKEKDIYEIAKQRIGEM